MATATLSAQPQAARGAGSGQHRGARLVPGNRTLVPTLVCVMFAVLGPRAYRIRAARGSISYRVLRLILIPVATRLSPHTAGL